MALLFDKNSEEYVDVYHNDLVCLENVFIEIAKSYVMQSIEEDQ
jgi:hypothetical protein